MIRLPLKVFVVLLSSGLAAKTDNSDADEYIADVDPMWGRGVFAFLNSLGQGNKMGLHSFPPDWSQERADNDEEKQRDSVVSNPELQARPDRETDGLSTNLDYPRLESTNDREPSFTNLRQSLSLWENVERKLKDMLYSAQQSQKLTLKDSDTHTLAVMSSVLGLASKLLERCSTRQYVKSYRETVSANLLQTFAMPAETTNKLLDLLKKIRRNISNVRALVLRNLCKPSDYSIGCAALKSSSPQLNREKQLIQALGSLARTVLASRSLQRAVNSYDEVAFLLNGQRETTLYVLSVKTARVLKLLSNRYSCDLPLVSQLSVLMSRDAEEESPKDFNHIALKHRYPLLIG